MCSRFQSVLNVECNHGRLLALHTASVPPTPFSLVLEAAPDAPWPEPGTAARVIDHNLTADWLHVDLTNTRLMRAIAVPKLGDCWDPRHEIAVLQPIAAKGAFGAWWDEQSNSRETLFATLRASAQKALRRLVATIRALDSETFDIAAAADQLIGLGPGGTPSGDDALIGFVGAWLRLGSDRRAASNVAESLARRSRTRTTRLAVEFYHHLVHGRLSYPLDQLLRAAALQDTRLLAHAADRLAQSGASSGRDTIAGVHAYLLTRVPVAGKEY